MGRPNRRRRRGERVPLFHVVLTAWRRDSRLSRRGAGRTCRPGGSTPTASRRRRFCGCRSAVVALPPIARALTSAGSLSIARGAGVERRRAEVRDGRLKRSICPDSLRWPAVVGVLGLEGLVAGKRPKTSLLAFQAAPIPISTGSVTRAQATASAGRAEIVTRRTTPEVRSATRIV